MKILNIAHRGGAGLRPENTMAAFAHAIDQGWDGAELDVQLSADGIAVVHHDYCLNPGYCRAPRAATPRNQTSDGCWLVPPTPRIKNLTLAQLKTYDLGRPDPHSDYAALHPALEAVDGARLPALAEVAAAARVVPFALLVELKSSLDPASADPVALADAALAVMRDQLDRTVFVGFDWRGLLRIREAAPAARCWFTTDKLQGDARLALDAIAAAGGAGWFPTWEDATAPNLAEAKARGLKVAVWTLNDPAGMKRLAALGVDAICTDRPDLLEAVLKAVE